MPQTEPGGSGGKNKNLWHILLAKPAEAKIAEANSIEANMKQIGALF